MRRRDSGDCPALFENLLELRYELADPLAIAAGFFGWALKRLQSRTFDQNKQYTSELVAILLQTSKGAAAAIADDAWGHRSGLTRSPSRPDLAVCSPRPIVPVQPPVFRWENKGAWMCSCKRLQYVCLARARWLRPKGGRSVRISGPTGGRGTADG